MKRVSPIKLDCAVEVDAIKLVMHLFRVTQLTFKNLNYIEHLLLDTVKYKSLETAYFDLHSRNLVSFLLS